jgi:hypothetical protein
MTYQIVRYFIIACNNSFIFNFSSLTEWINIFLAFFIVVFRFFLIFKYN